MKIKSFTNSIFSSRSYVLYDEQVGRAWLVDAGDVEPVVEFLRGAGLSLAGVLVTHCHFDHIYGLNGVCGEFAGCRVVTNEKGLEGLLSAKLNMSRYHEKPFVFEFGERVDLVADGDVVSLFDGVGALVVHVPGHNDSCLCFVVDCEDGGFVFTGDAFFDKQYASVIDGNRSEERRIRTLQSSALPSFDTVRKISVYLFLENPVQIDPVNQTGLTPFAKIRLTLVTKIKMPPLKCKPI